MRDSAHESAALLAPTPKALQSSPISPPPPIIRLHVITAWLLATSSFAMFWGHPGLSKLSVARYETTQLLRTQRSSGEDLSLSVSEESVAQSVAFGRMREIHDGIMDFEWGLLLRFIASLDDIVWVTAVYVSQATPRGRINVLGCYCTVHLAVFLYASAILEFGEELLKDAGFVGFWSPDRVLSIASGAGLSLYAIWLFVGALQMDQERHNRSVSHAAAGGGEQIGGGGSHQPTTRKVVERVMMRARTGERLQPMSSKEAADRPMAELVVVAHLGCLSHLAINLSLLQMNTLPVTPLMTGGVVASVAICTIVVLLKRITFVSGMLELIPLYAVFGVLGSSIVIRSLTTCWSKQTCWHDPEPGLVG